MLPECDQQAFSFAPHFYAGYRPTSVPSGLEATAGRCCCVRWIAGSSSVGPVGRVFHRWPRSKPHPAHGEGDAGATRTHGGVAGVGRATAAPMPIKTRQGLEKLLGAFRCGNPLERIASRTYGFGSQLLDMLPGITRSRVLAQVSRLERVSRLSTDSRCRTFGVEEKVSYSSLQM